MSVIIEQNQEAPNVTVYVGEGVEGVLIKFCDVLQQSFVIFLNDVSIKHQTVPTSTIQMLPVLFDLFKSFFFNFLVQSRPNIRDECLVSYLASFHFFLLTVFKKILKSQEEPDLGEYISKMYIINKWSIIFKSC